jgi:hypothetical protein
MFHSKKMSQVYGKRCSCKKCTSALLLYNRKDEYLNAGCSAIVYNEIMQIIDNGYCISTERTLSHALKNEYSFDAICILIDNVTFSNNIFTNFFNNIELDVFCIIIDKYNVITYIEKIELVTILLKKNIKITNVAIETACKYYALYPYILDMFIDRGCKMTKKSLLYLLEGGDGIYNDVKPSLFIKIINSGCPFPKDMFNICCKLYSQGFNYTCLEILVTHDYIFNTTENDMLQCLSSNKLISHHIVKYILDNGCPRTELIFNLMLLRNNQSNIHIILDGERKFKVRNAHILNILQEGHVDINIFNILVLTAMKDDNKFILSIDIFVKILERINIFSKYKGFYANECHTLVKKMIHNNCNYFDNYVNNYFDSSNEFMIFGSCRMSELSLELVNGALYPFTFYTCPFVHIYDIKQINWFESVMHRVTVLILYKKLNNEYIKEIALGFACEYLSLEYIEKLYMAGTTLPSYAFDIALARKSTPNIASYLFQKECKVSHNAFRQITHGILPDYLLSVSHIIAAYM